MIYGKATKLSTHEILQTQLILDPIYRARPWG